eukprot:112844-Hanusia_phi.AAC.1
MTVKVKVRSIPRALPLVLALGTERQGIPYFPKDLVVTHCHVLNVVKILPTPKQSFSSNHDDRNTTDFPDRSLENFRNDPFERW